MSSDLDLARVPPSTDRRDALLRAIAYVAGQLLADTAWRQRVDEVLRVLGEATQVDRVYVFENDVASDGALVSSQRWEWCAEGVEAQIDNPDLQGMPFREAGFGRWMDLLAAGRPVHGDVGDFPEDEQELLTSQGISSMVVVPISVAGAWWGFMGFDATGQSRGWTDAEVDVLTAAAGVLGSGIAQHLMVAELRESRRSFADAYRRERDAADRLREADDLKSRFLETISHELRTPLTAIRGLTHTLREYAGSLTGEQASHLLDRLEVNADRLGTRLQDLLETNHIHGSSLPPLEVQDVPLRPVLEAMVADCQPLRPRRTVIECDVERATLDVAVVERILMNLLLNVAIHTPETSRVWVRAQEASAGRLLLVVEDDGPGVPEGSEELIFAPFEHGPGRRAHSPGTGVGLSIVRGFAEHHGGRAWVTAGPAGGASFHVLLSCDPSPRGSVGS